MMVQSIFSTLGETVGTASCKKAIYPLHHAFIDDAIISLFQHRQLTSKPITMTQSAQTTFHPNPHKAMGLSRGNSKW